MPCCCVSLASSRHSLRKVLYDCSLIALHCNQELSEQNSHVYPRSVAMHHYKIISKVASVLSQLTVWNGRYVLLPVVGSEKSDDGMGSGGI